MARPDQRANDELRPLTFDRDFTDMADGSVLVKFGRTHVLCTASVEDDLPRWMRNSGRGWVTAEYSMLPGSSPERIRRRVSGRDQEIQRLIGRSLRAVVDLEILGERSITVDCDILQADGGTRTAAICGGFLALHDAITRLDLGVDPFTGTCAAISVGIVEGEARLDLPYIEDANAEVDMNIVMTGDGSLIEVQGTAEGRVFSRDQLNELLELGWQGVSRITDAQKALLAERPLVRPPRD
jgi:ribonuclease PH